MKRFLSALAFTTLIAYPAIAGEPIDAVWKEQEVESGFLTVNVAYSCDLLEARVKMLLKQVGAADDITVDVMPCGAYDRPSEQHQATTRFSTLVPAGDGDTNIIKAEWTDVELGRGQPRSIDGRDCQLLEQFTEQFLPKIEHEVIEGSVACGATRQTIIGRLKIKVLKPAPVDEAAKK